MWRRLHVVPLSRYRFTLYLIRLSAEYLQFIADIFYRIVIANGFSHRSRQFHIGGNLKHAIKLAVVFRWDPEGLLVRSPFEPEEVLATQPQNESHGSHEKEKEYNQQNFADGLANMEADGHSASVKAPEAVGADNRRNNK